jgi:hypothetical protein
LRAWLPRTAEVGQGLLGPTNLSGNDEPDAENEDEPDQNEGIFRSSGSHCHSPVEDYHQAEQQHDDAQRVEEDGHPTIVAAPMTDARSRRTETVRWTAQSWGR